MMVYDPEPEIEVDGDYGAGYLEMKDGRFLDDEVMEVRPHGR